MPLVLAMLVLAWGAAIVVRAVLAWFFHFALFVILAAGGVWLMARLWRPAGNRAI